MQITGKRAAKYRAWLSVLAALGFGIGCSEAEESVAADPESVRPPNVLLITMDTTRADALGIYGQERPTTPNIDSFAASGALFEQAYTASPSTLPSHATILTGKLPFAHGVRSNAGYQLGPDHVTLAEVYAQHGYVTAAEIAAPVIGRRRKLDQGFASYRDLESFDVVRKGVSMSARDGQDRQRVELTERDAGDITRRGLEFVREHASEPFFLWLHYFDPHSFYAPPSPWSHRFSDSLYHAEVHYTDYQIGRVLSELRQLGIAEQTIVTITADHGEGLSEHREPSHSFFVYDTTMRVPLLFSQPGRISGGRRIATPVRTVDIAPTLLALSGMPPLSGVQGVSLAGALLSGAAPASLDVYGESLEPFTMFGSSVLRFLRRDRWKYIHKLRPELYDLAADPKELANLAEQEPARVASLAARMRELVLRDAIDSQEGRVRVDRETFEQLNALGYVGATAPSEFRDSVDLEAPRGPDPLDQITDLDLYSVGWAAMKADKFGQAADIFREAHNRNRDSIPVTRALVNALREAGRDQENLELLRHGLELDPESLEFYGHLGELLVESGDIAGAVTAFREGLGVDPCDAPLRVLLANVMNQEGRYSEQRDLLREGIESCEATLDFRNDYAYLLATSPDPDVRAPHEALIIAREIVEKSERGRPDYIDTLACAYAAIGNFRRATALVSESLTMLATREVPEEVLAEYRAHKSAFEAGQAIGAGS